MKPPCMTVVKYLLPAIRVLVMKDLIEKYKMRKIDASLKMELTPAAITQYFKGKRGHPLLEEIENSEETMKMISELTEFLANDNVSSESMMERLCEICTTIRSKGLVDKLHHKDKSL